MPMLLYKPSIWRHPWVQGTEMRKLVRTCLNEQRVCRALPLDLELGSEARARLPDPLPLQSTHARRLPKSWHYHERTAWLGL